MEHIKYLMADFQKCNLHSSRGSALFYYDIRSIQLNAEIWILAWTDIWIDTSTGHFKLWAIFLYECLQHCYWSANSCYFELKDVASTVLWWYIGVTLNFTWFQGLVMRWIQLAHHHWPHWSMHIEQCGMGCVTPPL